MRGHGFVGWVADDPQRLDVCGLIQWEQRILRERGITVGGGAGSGRCGEGAGREGGEGLRGAEKKGMGAVGKETIADILEALMYANRCVGGVLGRRRWGVAQREGGPARAE